MSVIVTVRDTGFKPVEERITQGKSFMVGVEGSLLVYDLTTEELAEKFQQAIGEDRLLFVPAFPIRAYARAEWLKAVRR